MKSSVKFGLGDGNREIIEAHVVYSEDVRDRIARGFVEGMGYDSSLCYLRFRPVDGGQSVFEIYPLNGNIDELLNEALNKCSDEFLLGLRDLISVKLDTPDDAEPSRSNFTESRTGISDSCKNQKED